MTSLTKPTGATAGGNDMDIDGFRKYLLKQDRAKNTIDSYIFAIKFFFGRYDEITEKQF